MLEAKRSDQIMIPLVCELKLESDTPLNVSDDVVSDLESSLQPPGLKTKSLLFLRQNFAESRATLHGQRFANDSET